MLDRSFEKMAAQLESLSPIRTLARGYSFTTVLPNGKILLQADDAIVGMELQTTLAEGSIVSKVLSVRK